MDKKDKSIKRNCQAVSEAIGEVLMIAVVVIAFSSIAAAIFSDIATKSPHIPHANLESIRPDDNKVHIFHVGGEDINVADMKIVINAKGNSFQFNKSEGVVIWDSTGNACNSPAFTVGDCLEINTKEKIGILEKNDPINMSLIHIPSKQIILRAKL